MLLGMLGGREVWMAKETKPEAQVQLQCEHSVPAGVVLAALCLWERQSSAT